MANLQKIGNCEYVKRQQLTIMLLVANLVITKWWKNSEMTETLTLGYSSESTQQELSNECQHDRVSMVFKNRCVLVLWTKVASALEGLTILSWFGTLFVYEWALLLLPHTTYRGSHLDVWSDVISPTRSITHPAQVLHFLLTIWFRELDAQHQTNHVISVSCTLLIKIENGNREHKETIIALNSRVDLTHLLSPSRLSLSCGRLKSVYK